MSGFTAFILKKIGGSHSTRSPSLQSSRYLTSSLKPSPSILLPRLHLTSALVPYLQKLSISLRERILSPNRYRIQSADNLLAVHSLTTNVSFLCPLHYASRLFLVANLVLVLSLCPHTLRQTTTLYDIQDTDSIRGSLLWPIADGMAMSAKTQPDACIRLSLPSLVSGLSLSSPSPKLVRRCWIRQED